MTVDERIYVARNPNTPPDVLDDLADVSDVAYWVARSPTTPGHVLDRLADDPDPSVRAAVAGNANTPGHVLDRLAEDPDLVVRAAADGNANTPDEIFDVHCPHCGERMGTRIQRPFNDRERRALQAMHNRRCVPAA